MQIRECVDVRAIRPLYGKWIGDSSAAELGVDIDVSVAEDRLQQVVNAGGVLFVATREGKPVGCLSQVALPSPYSNQLIGSCTNWFAMPDSGLAGPRLLARAKQWSAERGCSHMMISASRFASGSHDSICRYCERIGGKQLETVYIVRLA